MQWSPTNSTRRSHTVPTFEAYDAAQTSARQRNFARLCFAESQNLLVLVNGGLHCLQEQL